MAVPQKPATKAAVVHADPLLCLGYQHQTSVLDGRSALPVTVTHGEYGDFWLPLPSEKTLSGGVWVISAKLDGRCCLCGKSGRGALTTGVLPRPGLMASNLRG
ncbi:hypothetical protein VTK73DRAFT_1425 [Phialemonium thermophilum]|uniref:Uncharacterized protein n=1 Tax=Phialemonium thermophilum TaxID=223376 RepID=A0ABR3VTF6_9PEZI